MPKLRVLAVLALLFTALTGAVSAPPVALGNPVSATLCVSTLPESSCYRTLDEAISFASPGDTILVAAGEHVATPWLWVNKPITLRGGYNERFSDAPRHRQPGATVIRGNIVAQANPVVLDGLTIHGAVATLGSARGPAIVSDARQP